MERNKVSKIVMGIIIAVTLTYIIYGTFFKSGPNFGFNSMSISKVSTDPLEVALDNMVINLGKGQFSYVKAEFSIKTGSKSSSKVLSQNREGVRRLILSILSRQDGDELVTDKGKQMLKKLISESINEQIGIQVEDVYFRNFVLAK